MASPNRAGTLSTRIRKNAKDLTSAEWTCFIGAIKALKARTRPGGVVSIYDEFCAMHMGAVEINRNWRRTHAAAGEAMAPADPGHNNPGCVRIYSLFERIYSARIIHDTSCRPLSRFLPWHRQFLCELESALQAVDPSVTLP